MSSEISITFANAIPLRFTRSFAAFFGISSLRIRHMETYHWDSIRFTASMNAVELSVNKGSQHISRTTELL